MKEERIKRKNGKEKMKKKQRTERTTIKSKALQGVEKLNRLLLLLDKLPLWWLGFVLLAITFTPYLILKEGSVFTIHDQLDETIMTYVLHAKYLGTKTELFPELLGGINTSGMQPSAVLFIPLYKIFPVFWAFVLQYLIVSGAGFFGMYGSVKKLTDSSILAAVAAGCFVLLPIQSIYGLSVWGVPLALYCFLNLYEKKHLISSFLLLLFFGLTSHLVLIGYVVLGFWALGCLYLLWKKEKNVFVYGGFFWLMAIYVWVNRSLFRELIFGTSSYVSHREELVNHAAPFWETVKTVFLESAQHAPSLHKYLILPICVMLLLGIFFRKKLGTRGRKTLLFAGAGFLLLAAIALLYGICQSEPVVAFKNSCSGFLRYFQLERFYWLYPAGWYLEFSLCFSLWWGYDNPEKKSWLSMPLVKLAVLAVLLLPTLQVLKVESDFYRNVNQINNGTQVTGYITWESYYAEDLMEQLEQTIGRDMTTYRVASLGMSPAPALMHGFYTVDGYSNNYPLEYKHRFRKVIQRELEKNEQTRLYFDEWGSRCYLFNGASGNAWMLGKKNEITYERLEFDMEALKELDCAYLFSAGEILNAEELGLKLLGYYETEKSYWGVWLYEL